MQRVFFDELKSTYKSRVHFDPDFGCFVLTLDHKMGQLLNNS